MTDTLEHVTPTTSTARSSRLGPRAAFALQVSMLVLFLAASSAPTPLYAVYQAEWGFSPVTVTIVFGVYALAVLAALLGLLDLNRTRGTVANGVGSIAGTAIGAIGSGLLVQFLPAPTHLIYLTLLGMLVLQAIGVTLMPESSARAAGALASLRPARRPLLLAVPALVAVWSLAGFYGSLGPSLVRGVVGSNAVVLGGLGLFVLAASGALTVLFVHAAEPRTVVLIGSAALIAGVGTTLLAIAATSTVAFFVGTAVAGVGFGAAFQGSLRSVLPFAAAHQRAGVLSTIYVVCYLAMGLPAVVAGFVVVDGAGVLITARGYGIIVMALAALAMLGALTRREEPAANGETAPLTVEALCEAS